jgi:hypothetical protein
MDRATIIFHLPTHRRAALQTQGDSPTARAAYDGNIGGYVAFLQEQGREAGFRIQTDNKDLDPVYTIDERGHEDKKAARAWLDEQPDIWEWIT